MSPRAGGPQDDDRRLLVAAIRTAEEALPAARAAGMTWDIALLTTLLGTYFYSRSEEGYEAQVKDRLARWRAAQEQALGLEQTETLPELSEADVLDIKRRTVRRAELE